MTNEEQNKRLDVLEKKVDKVMSEIKKEEKYAKVSKEDPELPARILKYINNKASSLVMKNGKVEIVCNDFLKMNKVTFEKTFGVIIK